MPKRWSALRARRWGGTFGLPRAVVEPLGGVPPTLEFFAVPVSDIVCFSHLRWDFVYQRPNHLMARAARSHRVFFVEEPVAEGTKTGVETDRREGLTIVRPVVPAGMPTLQANAASHEQLTRYLLRDVGHGPWLWYYTPMALRWMQPPPAALVIYDCMDELGSFRCAPALLSELEEELLCRADLVFTGGRSLYEAKRRRHPRVHLFPSSVDATHFGRAREAQPDPPDQAALPSPRLGYFGVVDERVDLQLVADVAAARPDWQLVMVGPVAKIEPSDLPRAANIHWLGLKPYAELPAYLSGWDVALMPFAINEATRYISPTKTPEYLAGGRPVVSTPVEDVVRGYGDEGLVAIAADAGEFVAAVERALVCDRAQLLERAERLLAAQSWDRTWAQMEQLAVRERLRKLPAALSVPKVQLPSLPADVLSSRATMSGSAGKGGAPGDARALANAGGSAGSSSGVQGVRLRPR